MPMIDVYAATGTFDDTKALTRQLAAALMQVEQVPDISLFRQNTAAFVHELPPGALALLAERRRARRVGGGGGLRPGRGNLVGSRKGRAHTFSRRLMSR